MMNFKIEVKRRAYSSDPAKHLSPYLNFCFLNFLIMSR
jgi:hypothetical protein